MKQELLINLKRIDKSAIPFNGMAFLLVNFAA
jgi:hypothetical protein